MIDLSTPSTRREMRETIVAADRTLVDISLIDSLQMERDRDGISGVWACAGGVRHRLADLDHFVLSYNPPARLPERRPPPDDVLDG